MRSTQEWEKALEGATPGPWGYYNPRGKDGHYDPIFGATPGDEIALVKRPADWKIMALAPEAVAEVVRLRRELEELRDHYVKRTTSCRERAADATKFFERRNSLRFAHSHTLTHEALTRILDGTHDRP